MDQKTVSVTVTVQLVRLPVGSVEEGSLGCVHPRTMEPALQEWSHCVLVLWALWLVWEENKDLLGLVDHQVDLDKDLHLQEDKLVQAKETVLVLK
jgi:hypothetical protein